MENSTSYSLQSDRNQGRKEEKSTFTIDIFIWLIPKSFGIGCQLEKTLASEHFFPQDLSLLVNDRHRPF